MKFRNEIIVDLPLETTIQFWLDDDQWDKWHEGFSSYTLLSGQKHQEGATAELKYAQGKNKFDLKETILCSELPNKIIGLYEHTHMSNNFEVRFEELESDQTKIITITDYFKFNSTSLKLLFGLWPSLLKKQVKKRLLSFKAFAENPDRIN